MKYIYSSLSDGEEVVNEIGIHWTAYCWPLFWIVFLVTAPIGIWMIIKLRCIERGVTNKRIIYKSGVISRKTKEMLLTATETVVLHQTILDRLLGCGTLFITGRGIGEVTYPYVDKPLEIKKAIENAIPD